MQLAICLLSHLIYIFIWITCVSTDSPNIDLPQRAPKQLQTECEHMLYYYQHFVHRNTWNHDALDQYLAFNLKCIKYSYLDPTWGETYGGYLSILKYLRNHCARIPNDQTLQDYGFHRRIHHSVFKAYRRYLWTFLKCREMRQIQVR